MADMLPQGYDNTNHFWDEGDVPAVSGTVEVGEIHTVTKEPGEDAEVAINNVGTDTAAVLNFTFGIPKGETGERGSQGPVGPQGQEGPQGERGPAGPQGEKGEKGDKGDTGETGPQGPQGIQGPKGDTGDTGAQGPQGIQGETGPQGPVGPAGPQGPAGADGTDGTDGTDGVTPVISATASVGTNTGTPSCTVTKTGTDAAPSFAFAFDGIKGADGQGSDPVPTNVDVLDSGTWTPWANSGTTANNFSTAAVVNVEDWKDYKYFSVDFTASPNMIVYFPAKKMTVAGATINGVENKTIREYAYDAAGRHGPINVRLQTYALGSQIAVGYAFGLYNLAASPSTQSTTRAYQIKGYY